MASVASSVIGAPITAIILVLELGSYEYAIASIVPFQFVHFYGRVLGIVFR